MRVAVIFLVVLICAPRLYAQGNPRDFDRPGPAKERELHRHRKAKLATENMFHTLLDMAEAGRERGVLKVFNQSLSIVLSEKEPDRRWQISTAGGGVPRWSGDTNFRRMHWPRSSRMRRRRGTSMAGEFYWSSLRHCWCSSWFPLPCAVRGWR